MKNKWIALALFLSVMMIASIAFSPITTANEDYGSNEPLTLEKNQLYLNMAGDVGNYIGFMSDVPDDPDGVYTAVGLNELGVAMLSSPDPFLGGPSYYEFSYTPVPDYIVKLDEALSGTAHILIGIEPASVPVAGEDIPAPESGSLDFSVSVSYGGQELASQPYSESINGEDIPVDLSFKISGATASFGSKNLTVLVSFDGGYGSFGAVIRLKGDSYVGIPVSDANEPPVASFTVSVNDLVLSVDASQSTDADGDELTYAWNWGDGNTGEGMTAEHTYSKDGTYTVTLTVNDGFSEEVSSPMDVTVGKNADSESGETPGFGVIALICAIGVATIILRKRH